MDLSLRKGARGRLSLLAAGLLAGCASVPTGPSVMVLPGSATSFEQFRADDAMCRSFALQQSGASPTAAAQQSAVTSAAVGTAVGAASGAAIGAAAGDAGAGAAAGAGAGLLTGAAAGSAWGGWSGYAVQQRYDTAYMQCMYARGNQIPVWGAPASAEPPPSAPTQRRVPPPPAGPPPPPPPGVG
jgi:hypothetical protein